MDSGSASATSSAADSDELARICRGQYNILLHACRACKFKFGLNWHSKIHTDLGSATSQAESPASAPSSTAPSFSVPAPSPPAPAPSPPVATTTTATAAPAATTQYAAELEQLHVLGFVDDEENMRALRVTNGDVNEAVGILLGGI